MSGPTRAGARLADAWSWRRLAVLLAVVVLCNLVFAQLGAALGDAGPPDLLLGATAAEIVATLDALGADGRDLYVRTAFVDVLYPLAYGTALATSLAAAARRLWPDHPERTVLGLLGLLALGADLVENAAFVAAAATHPDAPTVVLGLGAVANHVKWGAALTSLGLLVGLSMALLVRRTR